MPNYAANLKTIRDAHQRIGDHIHRTPVLTSRTLDGMAGTSLFFKCENFQRVGAFKMRGALNAVLTLPEEVAARGVVTHSSGNFAQAVAASAKIRGIPAHIVMPENAPGVKKRAVEEYEARVIPCPPTLAAREETAEAVRQETGASLLHPFNSAEVIAGQGTVALELNEQVPDLDAVVVPIGGGGLISGIALAFREMNPAVQVIAAEPTGADDAAKSKAAGAWIPQTNPSSIADGLLTGMGHLTWPVVRDLVESVVVVSDDATARAMRLVWERMKILIEPSAAVSVAAVLSQDFLPNRFRRVGVVLSGGNVDLDHLPFSDCAPRA